MFKPAAHHASSLHRSGCLVAAVFGLALAPMAMAAECFDASPLAGADRFAELEPSALSSAQSKAIGKLLRSLRGRWTARKH